MSNFKLVPPLTTGWWQLTAWQQLDISVSEFGHKLVLVTPRNWLFSGLFGPFLWQKHSALGSIVHLAMFMFLMIFDHLLVIWLSRPKRFTVEQLAFTDEASLQCLCPGLFPWNPAIRNLTKEKGTRWEKHEGQKELKVKTFCNIWRPTLILCLNFLPGQRQPRQLHEFLMDDTEE